MTTPPPPADPTWVPPPRQARLAPAHPVGAPGYPAPPPGFPTPQPGYQPPPAYPALPQGGYTAPPQSYAQPGYPYPQQVPVSPGGHRLAEFGDRLLAYLIDRLILFVVSLVLIVPLYLVVFFVFLNDMITTTTTVDGRRVAGEPQDVGAFVLTIVGLFLVVLVLSFALQYVYEVEMMFRSQTVGKRVMKIRVLPVDPAVPLTRKIAAKRFLVLIAASFLPGLSLLDGLWQLWDKPWQQCLHDKFAQTLVIKLNP